MVFSLPWLSFFAFFKIKKFGCLDVAVPKVPFYSYWCEAAHGVAGAGRATVFPVSIARAAAFDRALEHQAARIISAEGRAKHNDQLRHAGNSTEFVGGGGRRRRKIEQR